jgi:hypothetical protein
MKTQRFTRMAAGAALLAAVSVPSIAAGLVNAPPAGAAPSALKAANPPAFGPVPVGQASEQDVQVTNTGTSTVELDLSKSGNSNGILDFFPGPAVRPSPSSCLDQNDNPVPIAPAAHCTLGIFFVPTRFGPRATTMDFVDSSGGAFSLSVSGAGTAGYWLGASHGAVTPFGDAGFFGSASGFGLARPIVGMAATPDGGGYWLVGADGGVFSFGDAGFFGSASGFGLARPIVGMAATPDGGGYWLVGADGGVFSFGDAGFFGSASGFRLAKPISAISPSPLGTGYWLAGSDGGVFSFNVPFEGSLSGKGFADVTGLGLTTSPLPGAFVNASGTGRAQSFAGEARRALGAVSAGRVVRPSGHERS